MSDLISREIIKEQMMKYGFHAPDMTIAEFVEDCLPSADIEQEKGKWFIYHYSFGKRRYECNVCKNRCDFEYHFCPHCGAEMMMRGER